MVKTFTDDSLLVLQLKFHSTKRSKSEKKNGSDAHQILRPLTSSVQFILSQLFILFYCENTNEMVYIIKS